MKKYLIGIIAAFALTLSACDSSDDPTVQRDKFYAQMLAPNTSQHVYGGVLSVDDGTVTATDVPPQACVSAGARLVKKGIITVNGVTPVRVSSAILTELCYPGEKATLRFMPRQ